jgi:hypothetical protein
MSIGPKSRPNKEDWDGAIADYKPGPRIDPKNSAAFNERGLAWYHKGDAERRWPITTRPSESIPANANAYQQSRQPRKGPGQSRRGDERL